MNQEKIGKFIALKRKNNNLTQEQLAEKLGVTFKAVSKWECGNGLPDPSLFKPLCEYLNISVNDLLSGEEKRKDEGVIDYIKYQKKKNKRNILISIIVCIFLVILGGLLCYFINNYGKVEVYYLYGESDNFEYSDALFLKSNIKLSSTFSSLCSNVLLYISSFILIILVLIP